MARATECPQLIRSGPDLRSVDVCLGPRAGQIARGRGRWGEQWLALAGHEVGHSGSQTTRVRMLQQLVPYRRNPADGIRLDTGEAVARSLARGRQGRWSRFEDISARQPTAIIICYRQSNGSGRPDCSLSAQAAERMGKVGLE